MTSNISQAYPYSSETEAERAAAVAATVAGHAGLDVTIAGESSPLDPGERRWTYRHGGCGGMLHVEGARLVAQVSRGCSRHPADLDAVPGHGGHTLRSGSGRRAEHDEYRPKRFEPDR